MQNADIQALLGEAKAKCNLFTSFPDIYMEWSHIPLDWVPQHRHYNILPQTWRLYSRPLPNELVGWMMPVLCHNVLSNSGIGLLD